MKVFLISLKTKTYRRQRAIQLLDEQRLDYEIIDAVDGCLGEHPLLQRYDEEKFILHRGRKALVGELGCYASHMLAWEKAIEYNQPIIVLEDDFILDANFQYVISKIKDWTTKRHFIRLEPWRTKLFYTVENKGEVTLVKFLKVPQCATGYIITPKCAQAFINASDKITLPVDVFIRYTYLHKQAIYGVQPSVVFLGGDEKSTIGCRKKKIKKPVIKIKKAAVRLYSAVRCAFVNIISR
ncbi:glycosyltransferase family 25 protein [Photobacterium andalusiense]|uniref:Glycosyltransferase family 25 (LPS biosynthesis protein) n=1 Tax=Photobacterium andalusiense TaxID=2204296 RepID=A0A1Y6MMD7_9GAMM|nr:glycosyltransferase family 25 protein [Photobacterium andalusiense]SMY37089.1 Glycosyltransferase family 25 (LPS biosynthesis protein) [Photobacterium andalusiense]